MEPHPPHNQLNTSFAVKEVLGIMFLTATVWFALPYILGCRDQHEQCFPTNAGLHRCSALIEYHRSAVYCLAQPS